jgi:hypothetical protein
MVDANAPDTIPQFRPGDRSLDGPQAAQQRGEQGYARQRAPGNDH